MLFLTANTEGHWRNSNKLVINQTCNLQLFSQLDSYTALLLQRNRTDIQEKALCKGFIDI